MKIIVREEDIFMLKTWIPEEIPEKEELKKRIKEAGEKLYQKNTSCQCWCFLKAGVRPAREALSVE